MTFKCVKYKGNMTLGIEICIRRIYSLVEFIAWSSNRNAELGCMIRDPLQDYEVLIIKIPSAGVLLADATLAASDELDEVLHFGE